MDKIRIAVLGMGYVGLASGMAYAKHGFKTICTATTPSKAENLNKGIPPFYEPELGGLVKDMVEKGMLSGSTNNIKAIKESDVTFICVGTPSLPDGSADLSAVEATAKDIGTVLKDKNDYHVIVTKSTIVPGTTENLVLPIVEKYSDKKVGRDFGLCMNPEFLRQGQAVHDSLNPDRIVIGEYDKKSGDVLDRIYSGYDCPKMRCEIKAAELIKYAANSLLATKITFANEFSRISEKFNIDIYKVMKGVGMDFRINPMFLNAGCGFGGSCFPKDVKAITALSKKIGVETPLLNAVLYTNELQPMHFVDIIKQTVGNLDEKTIAFLGLSFKPDTDDTRATRALPIIEKLYQEGAHVKAYDPKAYYKFKPLTDLPIEYMDTWEDALKNADFVVVQSDWQEIKDIKPEDFKRLLSNPIVIDGRRSYNPEEIIKNGVTYRAIGWKNLDE
ncbi:MAG: UDP-glucose/GDP-mannose dehydrogenase family protein [Thermoplasmatales archaeon]|nr:MAG: UDP-glucose/GDP-mannose dehydrogenase family protein [Thermoplasmatales archaeon]